MYEGCTARAWLVPVDTHSVLQQVRVQDHVLHDEVAGWRTRPSTWSVHRIMPGGVQDCAPTTEINDDPRCHCACTHLLFITRSTVCFHCGMPADGLLLGVSLAGVAGASDATLDTFRRLPAPMPARSLPETWPRLMLGNFRS